MRFPRGPLRAPNRAATAAWAAPGHHGLGRSAVLSEPSIMIASVAGRSRRSAAEHRLQRERFYRQSEQRWRELAQGTEQAFVFADFKRLRLPRGRPAEIPVDPSHPVSREWGLVCEAREHGACMVGWEPPGRAPSTDAAREFEALLSVEPAVVREAAEAAATAAAPLAPDIAEAARRRLEELPAPLAESQLRLASGVTARLVSAMR
jgi:DICT domain-containing protein